MPRLLGSRPTRHGVIVPSTSLSSDEATVSGDRCEIDRRRGDGEDSSAGTNAQWMRCPVVSPDSVSSGPARIAAKARSRRPTVPGAPPCPSNAWFDVIRSVALDWLEFFFAPGGG